MNELSYDNKMVPWLRRARKHIVLKDTTSFSGSVYSNYSKAVFAKGSW